MLAALELALPPCFTSIDEYYKSVHIPCIAPELAHVQQCKQSTLPTHIELCPVKCSVVALLTISATQLMLDTAFA